MKYFWKGLWCGSLSQAFVTGLWEIQNPALREKRRWCMTLYGITFALDIVGLLFVFKAFGFFLTCWGISLIPWIVACAMAEPIEEQVLEQQKTPGPKTEGEDV